MELNVAAYQCAGSSVNFGARAVKERDLEGVLVTRPIIGDLEFVPEPGLPVNGSRPFDKARGGVHHEVSLDARASDLEALDLIDVAQVTEERAVDFLAAGKAKVVAA